MRKDEDLTEAFARELIEGLRADSDLLSELWFESMPDGVDAGSYPNVSDVVESIESHLWPDEAFDLSMDDVGSDAELLTVLAARAIERGRLSKLLHEGARALASIAERSARKENPEWFEEDE